MSKTKKTWVALLRGIGPITHKKMSMQQLRNSCRDAGFDDVSTYIASGNLLFKSELSKTTIQQSLCDILANYDLDNPVILRKPSELQRVIEAAPFHEASLKHPNHLLTVFFSKKLNKSAIDKLQSRDGPERIHALDRELCIDYVEGVANSKLISSTIDKIIGQPGTARNWNTLNKLIDLANV